MKLSLLIGAVTITCCSLAFAGGSPNGKTVSDLFNQLEAPQATTRLTSMSSLAEPQAMEESACNISLNPTGPSLVSDFFNLPNHPELNFSFERTLQQIIDTAPAEAQATSTEGLVQSLLDTYLLANSINPESGFNTPLDIRTGEANLNAQELIHGEGELGIDIVSPKAAFNRFDLAAADGSNCGEYRIVYGFEGLFFADGLMFWIFEAQYPNPNPNLGLEGCFPVADFWRSLDNNPEALTLIEQFFYTGVNHRGVDLPPVIHFDNYTFGSGQIRTNNFVGLTKWQLREFKTSVNNNAVVFELDTAKNNPLAELYGANGSDPFLNALKDDFKATFIDQHIEELLSPELSGNPDIINNIHVNIDNRFNEFQSDAQGNNDNPTAIAVFTDFRLNIANKLTELNRTDITVDMVLNRAGSQTCGGCHQFSNNVPISSTLSWPAKVNFVHVEPSGSLSSALVNEFLPHRANVLEQFVCAFLAGLDSDGDGVSDNIDAFPNDPTETLDNDNDGIGNNADTDDDNDTMLDDWEIQFGLDPLDADDANTDLDNDGISNLDEFLNNSDPTDIESPNPSILAASATPQIENAIINEAGEVFKYARIIENTTDATVKAKRVEIIKFPDGTPYVYAKYNAMKLGPFALNKALTRKITVKDWWPAGDYQFELHALTETLARGTSDSFAFSKAGAEVSQTANIEVHAVPANASSSVPAEGGKITFQRKLLNNTAETQHVKRWEIIEFPSGALYGYSGALAFQLGSNGVNQQLSRRLTIPSWFPSGNYIYHHRALTEESPVGVHASFSFTKAE